MITMYIILLFQYFFYLRLLSLSYLLLLLSSLLFWTILIKFSIKFKTRKGKKYPGCYLFFSSFNLT